MENQELLDLYRSFIEASLLLLTERISNDGKLPRKQEEVYSRVINENSKTYNLKSEMVLAPDFDKLINDYKNQIEELPQFINCKELLAKVNINKDNHETIYLFSFLKYYLEINQSLNFNIDIFNKIYPGVEDFIFYNKIKLKQVSPLKNFKSDIDEIDLGNNIKIKKLTEKDFDEMFKGMKNGISYISENEVLEIGYQIEMLESVKNGSPPDYSKFMIVCYNIISALRLFKTGIIGDVSLYKHYYVKYKYESWEPIWQPVKGSIAMMQQIKNPSQYSLLSNETKDFVKFWNKYNSYDFNKNRSVDIAIRRFNYAYEKELTEDKLIDYIIILEALFINNNDNTELNYKLALRTALFIGSENEERKQIRKDIKKAYSLRSKIVHGSFIIKELEELQGLMPKIEEYVRLSIKIFLNFNSNPEEIIKKIEENLLCAGKIF